MIWKFFKTNWFVIGCVVLVMVAIFRKNPSLLFKKSTVPPAQELTSVKREKYTDQGKHESGKSLFGLLPESSPELKSMPRVSDDDAGAFLQRFGRLTVGEQKKFGIPASVLLASAYVNSFAGERDVAKTAHNYFGISCSPTWDGKVANIGEHCYRRYATPWESFRDFSIYLSRQDWVVDMRRNSAQDWQAWVNALAEHQDSDVAGYREEMIKVIQAYRLFELDKA